MIEAKERSDEFDTIVNYYRILLSKPDLSEHEKENFDFISRELYTFLFGDIVNKIINKKNLIIIPDGVLGFLPFETLIMPDGRYLVEKYNIKYTQSLTVSEIIAGRHYTDNRKPFLAFGGAVYEKATYLADMVSSERELEYIKKNTLSAMNRGESTQEAYSSLGLGSWGNIPGSLAEVTGIREIEKNAEIVTGKDVSEDKVKTMSRNGDLKNYKVIHFATHGLVVPEFPELSAVVLSLSEDEKGNEDGYLRMNEIAGLDIQADFVNLSACDTGLGKIYGGEGVVGLTQSFLIAGANGLSVSLWRVEDESTMKFMLGMYTLAKEKDISYDMAITEMKRKFISGEIGNGNYKSPFFWAPFVYYGR